MIDQPPTDEPTDTSAAVSEPHRIEPVRDDDNKDYALHNRSEILGILRSMSNHGSLMTLYFNHGKDFLLSAVLKVSQDGLSMLLDVGSDPEMNRRALAADKLICVSNLDKIKIQFTLGGVRLQQYEGRPAFVAAIPDSLLRLQRREFYRFVMPVLQPLKCFIPQETGDDLPGLLEVNIVDLSGGGVGLITKEEETLLQSDQLLRNCRIDLQEIGQILVSLRIRSVNETTSRTGARHMRAGCQFVELSSQTQLLIQRFIIKAERERKARDSGLA